MEIETHWERQRGRKKMQREKEVALGSEGEAGEVWRHDGMSRPCLAVSSCHVER
jgi:hypothetical protein